MDIEITIRIGERKLIKNRMEAYNIIWKNDISETALISITNSGDNLVETYRQKIHHQFYKLLQKIQHRLYERIKNDTN